MKVKEFLELCGVLCVGLMLMAIFLVEPAETCTGFVSAGKTSSNGRR